MALKAVTTTGGAGQFATLNTVKTLTQIVGTIPPTATHLWIECEAQNVRYTLDGTAATAAIGLRLLAGTTVQGIMLTRAQWKNLKMIEEAATAKVNWQFYKT